MVSGRVIVTLRKPQKTRGLRLSFKGFERTHWTTGSGNNRRTHTQTIVHFDYSFVLFGYPRGQAVSDHDLVELPPGNSVYPFRFQIPTSGNGIMTPPSIELTTGRIRYEIAAYIDIVRWFDTWTPTYPIRIRNSVIVNTQNLLEPLTVKQEKIMGCLTNKGMISCICSIDKRGYLPGEQIVINSQITNESTRNTIKYIEASLNVYTTFRAHGSHRRTSAKICFIITKDDIAPQSQTRSLQHLLTIPNNLALLTTNANLIVVSYEIKMKLVWGFFGNNIKATLPILIGDSILSNQQQQPGTYGINQQPEINGINQQPEIYGVNQQQPATYGMNQQPEIHGINQQPEIYGNNQPMSSGWNTYQPQSFQYTFDSPQHPQTLDVELPPYTEIRGSDSY